MQQDDLEQYRYCCNKCQKKVSGGKTVCHFCRICLCSDCNDTLSVLNFTFSFLKEKHEKCGQPVDLV